MKRAKVIEIFELIKWNIFPTRLQVVVEKVQIYLS